MCRSRRRIRGGRLLTILDGNRHMSIGQLSVWLFSCEQEFSPFTHQRATPIEEVSASVSRLDSVRDLMCKRLVCNLLRHVRAFGHPIGEGAAKAVNGGISDLHVA